MPEDVSRSVLRRMLGHVAGKRVLELGCGSGDVAIGLALDGATVIAVDTSSDHIDAARASAQAAEVRLEFQQTDLADLAFLRADSVDLAFSDGALASGAYLDRVFRQVHRVLRTGGVFAFSLPHPMTLCAPSETTPEGALPLTRPALVRSYFDESPIEIGEGTSMRVVYPHRTADILASLLRAGYKIDVLAEPEPARGAAGRSLTPDNIIWRAKKEGV